MAARHPQSRILEVLALYAQGVSYAQIGAALNITRCAVAGIINRHARRDA